MRLTEITAGTRFESCFVDAIERDSNVLVRTSWQFNPELEFAASVAQGLEMRPKQLAYRFLYDARGSELFERITAQPEYYPTRTEADILQRAAPEIRQLTGPVTVLELGSGSSAKTGCLLEAYLARDGEQCYVPIDVSQSALQGATKALTRRYADLQVVGIHGTYNMGLRLMKSASPAMLVFLGSSIGNFTAQEEEAFWHSVARHTGPGDFFLLGIDLVKETHLLNAAYNDAAGVTEAFIKNILVRMNRELHTAIDIDAVEYNAEYLPDHQRVEMTLRFPAAQTIDVAAVGKRFTIDAGEQILVEISRKFQLATMKTQLNYYGFHVRHVFTDANQHFALMLLQRADDRNVIWQ
ncbi:MAG: L-histidine N(alpha)-methyltransferase [Myxococcota bacterium]|nr:L-histidine N(alpha)-methyltransferase [Myxococcota bacterium]